jgi:GTP-sensing pleiotropic transcriptional regulator CodY
MSKFNKEEKTLICLYNAGTGTRTGLISELNEMQTHLEQDEKELLELTRTVVGKLSNMSDEEFESIANELIVDF